MGRARGRARRCGTRRPVTSDSARTATPAPASTKPWESGAATTCATAPPGGGTTTWATTGACTPSSPSTVDRRDAPAGVAAHTTTAEPASASDVTCDASRAESPATGSKPRTDMAGTDGPSGTPLSASTPAPDRSSSRSYGRWRVGMAPLPPPDPAAGDAPQVPASTASSSPSSTSSSPARSRMRRGSTSTTCAPGPRWSVKRPPSG